MHSSETVCHSACGVEGRGSQTERVTQKHAEWERSDSSKCNCPLGIIIFVSFFYYCLAFKQMMALYDKGLFSDLAMWMWLLRSFCRVGLLNARQTVIVLADPSVEQKCSALLSPVRRLIQSESVALCSTLSLRPWVTHSDHICFRVQQATSVTVWEPKLGRALSVMWKKVAN